jgi:hypothetical protein
MDSSHIDTPPKNEKADDEYNVDLTMFDLEDDDFDVDFLMFDSKHDKSSDPDDCCHHIEMVSTSIQMFNIFITN